MTRDGFDWRFEGRRPALPTPFLCGLALWTGCAACFSYARGLEEGACSVLSLGAVLLACALVAAVALLYSRSEKAGRASANDGGARMLPRLLPACLCTCMLLLGCGLGMGKGALLHAQARANDGVQVTCEATAVEDSSEGAYGESCLLSLDLPGEGSVRASGRLPSGDVFLCGERATVTVALSAADIERSGYGWSQGSALTAKVTQCSRETPPALHGWLLRARASAIETLDDGSETGSLLQALVCGYRRGIKGTDLYAAFQGCGLAHLIAVSGAHLVIVTSLFAGALRAVRAPRRASIGVLVGVMASYLVFSGAPISAVRATIMSGVGIMSLFARRRPSALSALGVCLIALICVEPSSSASPSLALSVLSTAGIVIFSPLFSSWVSSAWIAKAKVVSEPLVITISAGVLSQPFACALFAKLPLVSPLANMACAPLFPLCCAAGLVYAVLSVAHAPLAGAFALAVRGLANVMRSIVYTLSHVPYASVPVDVSMEIALACTVTTGFALWVCWNEHRVILVSAFTVAACLVLVIPFVQAQGDRVIMFDVGQGDAFLLQSRGQTLLIDTGNQDAMLLRGLGAHGLAHIDSVLVTHADDDHCGSLDAIAGAVNVDRVLVAAGVTSNQSEACKGLVSNARAASGEIRELSAGDRFNVGAFSLTVVWPHELADDAGNADSICLLAEYDGNSDGVADATALFTGDAEREQVKSILDERGLHDVDVLKVGHHGSRNALDEDEAKALSPEIALIGVGEGNRYGHPTPETLALLSKVGSHVYRTDKNGETICTFAPNTISVSCEK